MAEAAIDNERQSLAKRLIPNELLAALSALLAISALFAIGRGRADWSAVPALVWVHLGSMLIVTTLTPVMLLRGKGTWWHRRLGYVWVTAMLVAAGSSLFFKLGTPGWGVFSGHFSLIHILSVFVLVQAPTIVRRARRHDRAGHEAAVRGMVIGALLVAGFFTFLPTRTLGGWLLG